MNVCFVPKTEGNGYESVYLMMTINSVCASVEIYLFVITICYYIKIKIQLHVCV